MVIGIWYYQADEEAVAFREPTFRIPHAWGIDPMKLCVIETDSRLLVPRCQHRGGIGVRSLRAVTGASGFGRSWGERQRERWVGTARTGVWVAPGWRAAEYPHAATLPSSHAPSSVAIGPNRLGTSPIPVPKPARKARKQGPSDVWSERGLPRLNLAQIQAILANPGLSSGFFTRERSQVRNPPRPSKNRLETGRF